ncbi:MAG: site-specific integrase, partial [Alphaproteobacteria bacterium]|nr:site-specific integrase [Alphaproteobacteria bacterium]
MTEDLRQAIVLWLDWLAAERRASAHTVAAYGRDLAQFFDFLGEHRGEMPSLPGMAQLSPADFRAFLAQRAGDGRARTTLARGLSVLRGFVRFLERRRLAVAPGLAALRAPKLPQSVPKPLTVEDAGGAIDTVGELSPSVWQQKRDIAILTLLYGCGLRLSEALGLTVAEVPRGEVLVVTGKGRKPRHVPVLAAVRDAVADYVAACPYPLAKDGPLFVGARGGPLNPRLVQHQMQLLRGLLGL